MHLCVWLGLGVPGWDKDQAASSLDDQLLGTTCVPIVGAERMVQGAATSGHRSTLSVATPLLPELRDSESKWQTNAREGGMV